VRQSFSTIDEAKREAQIVARQIAAVLAKATGLSIAEREAYDAAKAILEAAGIPLLSAVEEYAQCRKILEGKSLLSALSDYAQRTKGVRIGAKLPDLIEAFFEAKKQDGASDRYLCQLKSALSALISCATSKPHRSGSWRDRRAHPERIPLCI
jgi:hypothetical protein